MMDYFLDSPKEEKQNILDEVCPTIDIATGWIENCAIWEKEQMVAFEYIESIENSLPFKVRGFDSDNGN